MHGHAAEILRLLTAAIAAEHQASADWAGNRAAALLEQLDREQRRLVAPLGMCRACGCFDPESVRARSV